MTNYITAKNVFRNKQVQFPLTTQPIPKTIRNFTTFNISYRKFDTNSPSLSFTLKIEQVKLFRRVIFSMKREPAFPEVKYAEIA